jgi:hypothetical protein
MKKTKCFWCNNIGNEKDHFFPFSLGGKTKDNIVMACRKCNAQKQNKIWIKNSNGMVLKPKHKPKKFTKIIEYDKYYVTVLSFVSVIPKLNKIGRKMPIPKDILFSEYGKELN